MFVGVDTQRREMDGQSLTPYCCEEVTAMTHLMLHLTAIILNERYSTVQVHNE